MLVHRATAQRVIAYDGGWRVQGRRLLVNGGPPPPWRARGPCGERWSGDQSSILRCVEGVQSIGSLPNAPPAPSHAWPALDELDEPDVTDVLEEAELELPVPP